MQKTFILLTVLLLTGLVAASCGGGNGGEEDATTDDVAAEDQTDQTTDTPGDRPPDTPAENPTDQPGEENPADVVPDSQPDVVPDTEPDGELPPSRCVESGGYCTTYPIIANPCVLCPDVGEDHYKPSRPADDAMGCTVEGEGAGPWCCVPSDITDPNDCEADGGECYGGGGDCPVGWVENTALDCNGGQRCCAPGPDCTT